MDDRQKKYLSSEKGKVAQKKAQEKYDEDIERRRKQKRDYMRKKRLENPNYCKWR